MPRSSLVRWSISSPLILASYCVVLCSRSWGFSVSSVDVARILIADDEKNLRRVLSALLRRDGHEVESVPDGATALVALERAPFDILITDIKMPKITGLELLARVRALPRALPVVVITAHGTVDTAVKALKAGAFDFITKPFDKEELRLVVRKAVAVNSHRDGAYYSEVAVVDQAAAAAGRFGMVGQSRAMRDVFTIIDKVAGTPSTVLINGESGTGKELVANALHQHSGRREQPLIKVNCAAIPKDLMESELFGYEQGAFTGAVGAKPGRFELADGGTLFLDEVGEIPVGMQVKLLRALQESEFERVGGVRTISVDIRLVAATNSDLEAGIEAGWFREDLYYRLNVVPIYMPPLRVRTEDINSLAAAFIAKINRRLGRGAKDLTGAALQALMAYDWPGNIRELENTIERSLVFCEGQEIDLPDLPEQIRQGFTASSTAQSGQIKLPTAPDKTTSRSIDAPKRDDCDGESEAVPMKEIVRQARVDLERELIEKALEKTRGNVSRAANVLGISRKGLQNKIRDFGLDKN